MHMSIIFAYITISCERQVTDTEFLFVYVVDILKFVPTYYKNACGGEALRYLTLTVMNYAVSRVKCLSPYKMYILHVPFMYFIQIYY